MFCARGDQQLEGIDFFETYAPVVQWAMIHLMFTMEILLGLNSMQTSDVTFAFLHEDLKENKTIYIDMQMGFTQYGKNGKKKCASISIRHYMGCIKVLEHFGSTLRSNLKRVVLGNQSLIHICSLDQMCLV